MLYSHSSSTARRKRLMASSGRRQASEARPNERRTNLYFPTTAAYLPGFAVRLRKPEGPVQLEGTDSTPAIGYPQDGTDCGANPCRPNRKPRCLGAGGCDRAGVRDSRIHGTGSFVSVRESPQKNTAIAGKPRDQISSRGLVLPYFLTSLTRLPIAAHGHAN